jgi:uncharacterized phage-like protein YoqJ
MNKTCCFIGHRTLTETQMLKTQLRDTIEHLIVNEGVDTFLFGSKSQFTDLCLEVVTSLKEQYSHIMRIYVRAEFQHINDSYRNYLLNFYEDTYFSEILDGAHRSIYIKRNQEMIDKSKFCIFYYNAQNTPVNRKSGTLLALDYAAKKNRQIINISH